MKLRKALMATASVALFACVGGAVEAQQGGAAANRPMTTYKSPLRHLLYIATPGDEGADDQSGVVVLDADHDYRFVKRISYGLPASEMNELAISSMQS